MEEENFYLVKAAKSIALFNSNIIEVKNLAQVKATPYSKENLDQVQNMLKKKNLNDLKYFREGTMSEEILIILTFLDHQNNCFAALVYDNDLLWQDKKILNIYPL